MGKLILIDFKKRAEHRALHDLLSKYSSLMDEWIVEYGNTDPTPPNEEQCTELELGKIQRLLLAFQTEAGHLIRVQDEIPSKVEILTSNLKRRQGKLYHKFSKSVATLQNQASTTLQYCVDTMMEYETMLLSNFPTTKTSISTALQSCRADCELYIATSFPEGISGLDSYDDELPDGLPSYSTFKDQLVAKEIELQEKNQASIPIELERIKVESKRRFQQQINDAIKQALKDIEADLADDEKLPFLTDEEMNQFRTELISSAKEYGESRLDMS